MRTLAAADDVLRVTLDDALAMLRRQSPELLAGTLKVQAAAGDVRTARLLPNPTVSAGVGNLPLGRTNPPGLSVGQTVTANVGVEQEIPLWGKRGARIEAAEQRRMGAEAERADLERQLAFEVRSRFVALLEATERLRLAGENLERYRETIRVSEARAREGDISPAELDKVRLEERSFAHEVDDAALDRREAAAALLPLLGSPAADVDAVGTLTIPTAPSDVEDLVGQALARRPDVKAAERERTAAEAALRLARREPLPNVTVGVGYTHSEFQISGDLANQIGTTFSVPVPVFDRNQGNIIRAEAEALTAGHELDHVKLAVAQEVRSAVTRYDVSRTRAQRFADGFLRQATNARKAAEASYREGAVSLLEFLEAERTAIQTARDNLDALREVNTAAYDITRAAALEVSP
ncbi:MAG TPA: TolC family protein [Candidatus Binatia bacterium]|nr:TolC family protein [Candidatus Binatia bacterium]